MIFLLKVHLVIEENSFEAVSERFRQFKGKKIERGKWWTEIKGSCDLGSHLSDNDLEILDCSPIIYTLEAPNFGEVG